MLTASAAPEITRQPTNQVVATGSDVSMNVGATGQPPLRYQWRRENTNLPRGTNAVLNLANVRPIDSGAYSVVVSDATGASTVSAPAMLSVLNPVGFVATPESQMGFPGGVVQFSFTATGSPPVRAQWFFQNSPIQGATNQTLIISNLSANHVGEYSVRIGNPVSSEFSPPATLTLGEHVQIIGHPESRAVVAGQPVDFDVQATGTPPLLYQWFFETNLLPSATNKSLSISSVTPVHDGRYWVRVSNDGGGADSRSAFLTVLLPPRIIDEPKNVSVPFGNSASLSVSAGGTQPLLYQWLRGNEIIPAATNREFTVQSATFADDGAYHVVVRNDYGSATSSVAMLNVFIPELPLADNFADALPVLGMPLLMARGSNILATAEPNEPRHDDKPFQKSVWLSWTAPTNGFVTIDTGGSDFDTLLAVYRGESLADLVAIASDDDAGTNQTSQVRFNAIAGMTYRIAIAGAGYLEAAGQIEMQLRLVPSVIRLPIFLSNPRAFAVREGEDALLDFTFDADENVQIEWLFEDAPVSNAVRTTNLVPAVNDLRVGRYRARIVTPTHTNLSRFGEVQINSRGLSQVLARDKLGDARQSGLFVTADPLRAAKTKAPAKSGSGSHGYSGTQVFSTVGATRDTGEPIHCGIGGGRSEWFAYQAETNGTLRIDTEGSSFDTVLAVYIGPGDSYATLTNVACDNNSGSNGLTSKVIFQATQGTIYWIAVDGVGNASGTVRLNFALGQPLALTAHPQSSTVPSGTNVTFSVTASGMTNYSYQWRFNGTNLPGATGSSFTRVGVQASHSGSYEVVVRNPINMLTSAVAVLSVYSGTLSITSQPQSVAVLPGASAAFSVGATGSGALAYQWQCNGTNIPGATASTLPINNVQVSHAGTYAVRVTDANGPRLSSNATLTVLLVPAFSLHPASRTVTTGSVVSLNALATGTPAPVYQWRLNGAPLPGATASTLAINNFSTAHEGEYSVLASNIAGVTVSATALLLANSPVRLTNLWRATNWFGVRVIGVTNGLYVLDRSINLESWSPLVTNAAVSGIWDFAETNDTVMRYYRARALP
jgi:hypothetical protein